MTGLLLLLLFLLAGAALARLSGLPLPGNVLGMVLLALALQVRLVRVEHVKPAADFLVRNMALFFVPAGVGVIAYGEPLRQAWVPILVASVASTLAVLATVGWIAQRAER